MKYKQYYFWKCAIYYYYYLTLFAQFYHNSIILVKNLWGTLIYYLSYHYEFLCNIIPNHKSQYIAIYLFYATSLFYPVQPR